MWLKAIPKLELVGIYRHPFLVADSLMRRNHKTADEALELWFTYNMILYWLACNKPIFPIIEFSIDPADFNNQLTDLISILKLDSRSVDFFDANLRTQKIPDLTPDIANTQIANRCINLYKSLKELAESSMQGFERSAAA